MPKATIARAEAVPEALIREPRLKALLKCRHDLPAQSAREGKKREGESAEQTQSRQRGLEVAAIWTGASSTGARLARLRRGPLRLHRFWDAVGVP